MVTFILGEEILPSHLLVSPSIILTSTCKVLAQITIISHHYLSPLCKNMWFLVRSFSLSLSLFIRYILRAKSYKSCINIHQKGLRQFEGVGGSMQPLFFLVAPRASKHFIKILRVWLCITVFHNDKSSPLPRRLQFPCFYILYLLRSSDVTCCV